MIPCNVVDVIDKTNLGHFNSRQIHKLRPIMIAAGLSQLGDAHLYINKACTASVILTVLIDPLTGPVPHLTHGPTNSMDPEGQLMINLRSEIGMAATERVVELFNRAIQAAEILKAHKPASTGRKTKRCLDANAVHASLTPNSTPSSQGTTPANAAKPPTGKSGTFSLIGEFTHL
jgi:hypothetical protein